jgi:hypothetical protein
LATSPRATPANVSRVIAAGPGAVGQRRVVVRPGGQEHADIATGQRTGDDGGVLQRLPGQLERQPLLRIHGGRHPRRDAEERGVEPVDIVEEGTPPNALGLPPSALGDRVPLVPQQPPERRRVRRPG